MRPVPERFPTSQAFGAMPTAGVIGNRNAPSTTPEYWVGLYGNYQPFGHPAEDIACPVGTPVRAPAPGVVLYAGWGRDLPGTGNVRQYLLYRDFPGIVTVIQHDGWKSVLAHLSDNDLAPAGTVVAEGQIIALSGDTGGVDPHLHVEALVDDRYTTGHGLIYGRDDPRKYYTTLEEIVPNAHDKVFKAIDGNIVDLETLLNSIDSKTSEALAAVRALLSVELPDPTDPGKTYPLATWIVWGATNAKLAAGASATAASNTGPAALAEAITDAQTGATAQAVADLLAVTVRPAP